MYECNCLKESHTGLTTVFHCLLKVTIAVLLSLLVSKNEKNTEELNEELHIDKEAYMKHLGFKYPKLKPFTLVIFCVSFYS